MSELYKQMTSALTEAIAQKRKFSTIANSKGDLIC